MADPPGSKGPATLYLFEGLKNVLRKSVSRQGRGTKGCEFDRSRQKPSNELPIFKTGTDTGENDHVKFRIISLRIELAYFSTFVILSPDHAEARVY